MSETVCGVCKTDPSKYKCPHCQMPYCSVKCFKTHILEHENDAKPTEPIQSTSETTNTPNPPSQEQTIIEDTKGADPIPHTQTSPYESLQQHPQFQHLFTRYPNLKSQLQRVHNATTNPAISNTDIDEDSRTNGQRNQQGDRVRGQWTQEKANELAAEIMVSLMEREEGVREFMALVKIVFEPEDQVEGDAGREGQGRAMGYGI